ncbi:MAG: hypothetical protein IKW04_05035 [Clostridia bacterium]|nr:hypothetical protein [Clostridia bacterium]
MKEQFKINFQLFAEGLTEDDLELLRSFGLDEEGNALADDNDGDTQNGPQNINEESINPEETPDNLSESSTPDDEVSSNSDSDENANLNTPQEPEPAKEQTPLILGKFKNQAELERAYQEQQNFIGRQSTEIGELRSRLQGQPQPTSPTQNPSPAGEPDLFSGLSNEQLLAAFSKDPKQFLKGLIDIANSDSIRQAKQALRYETEKEKYLNDFFQNNPDFEDMKDEFLAISDDIKNPEYAINIIRGRKLGNLGNLFSDTSYLKKHLDSDGMKEILSDVSIIDKLGEKVVQKIIDDNLKKVKANQSKVNLMTADAGSAPKTPPKKYQSLQDVTEDAVSFLKELEKNK